MSEEVKKVEEKKIIKEESTVKEQIPKDSPIQKLVWKEEPIPIIHIVKGHVVKINEDFLYFKGEDTTKGILVIPIRKVEEIK